MKDKNVIAAFAVGSLNGPSYHGILLKRPRKFP